MADSPSCRRCGGSTVAVFQEGGSTQVCPACDTPDRACTWCQVPMIKKLVGDGRYLHYLCPQCTFQHSSKYQARSAVT